MQYVPETFEPGQQLRSKNWVNVYRESFSSGSVCTARIRRRGNKSAILRLGKDGVNNSQKWDLRPRAIMAEAIKQFASHGSYTYGSRVLCVPSEISPCKLESYPSDRLMVLQLHMYVCMRVYIYICSLESFDRRLSQFWESLVTRLNVDLKIDWLHSYLMLL